MAWKAPGQYRINNEIGSKMMKAFNVSVSMVTFWIEQNNLFRKEENQGFYILPNPKNGRGMYILVKASTGSGWEHVSVSIPTEQRCPTWPEMCFVKSLFWDDEDCVVQFHPPKSQYVNNHEFCLHLWKPTDQTIPQPSSLLVGTKS